MKGKTKEGLKILFCTAEAQPFATAGGLSEVSSGLPKAIRADSPSTDIRVIMPLYKMKIDESVRAKFKFLGSMDISFAKRQEYCGIFEFKNGRVIYYFIDNEKYFNRENVYAYWDDTERFAFFSKACIDTMKLTGFKPDVLHANDWHTALTVVYLKTSYKDIEYYSTIKALFMIHNLEIQGNCGFDFMNVLEIDYRYKDVLDYDGQINLVKAAITCADWINVNSPTYAEEIKNSFFARGLENCTRENAYKISGILNGVDYEFWNPQTDKELFANYNGKVLEGKAANKRGIQQQLGLKVDASIPVVVFNGRLTWQKGIDLIRAVIDDILGERLQFIMLGGYSENQYIRFFDEIERKYPEKFRLIRDFSNDIAKKLHAAGDLMLMPSLYEPCGLSNMISCRYGTVPIVREISGLKDAVRDFGCETGGNGYTFKNYNAHDMLYSIRRGVNDFVIDGPAWEDKVRICMEKDFSWKESVKKYLELYRRLKKGE